MNPVWRRWRLGLGIVFAVAAAVWLAAMVALRLRPVPAVTVSPLPPDCTQTLAADLARRGVTAQVVPAPDGVLVVEISPAGWPADQAAQLMWVALDVAAPLFADCPYRQLQLTLPLASERLHAQVSAADLTAWERGQIDDAELGRRVLYWRIP